MARAKSSPAVDLLERVRAEIDARRAELAPRLAEYEQLLSAAQALGLGPTSDRPPARGARAPRRAKPAPALKPAAAARARAGRSAKGSAPARTRAPRGAAQTAILSALEHGSHTVAELAVVTAMSGQNVRENLRRLLGTGAVTRAKRDGKAAYAHAASPSR
jgi:DNA-binding transcriptional ArsR family regulator